MRRRVKLLARWLARFRRAVPGAAPEEAAPQPGSGPYRTAPEVPGNPHRVLDLARFRGCVQLGILEESDGFVRYLVALPECPRAALACIAHMPSAWVDLAVDEARLVTHLAHPRLARVLDIGCADGFIWHLEERPAGATLAELSARTPGVAPDLDACLAAFAAFAEGLDAAHRWTNGGDVALGLRHGRLGPTSLLIGQTGSGVVVDWELAALRAIAARDGSGPDGITGVKTVPADFRFDGVAPEAIRGAVDVRADVFSLAALLYEISTGTQPFTASTPREALERVLRGEPEPPSTHVPGYPPELSALLLRALAKDPAARPTTGEIAASLRALLVERGVDDAEARAARWVRGSVAAAPR
ncbi:serine/threonine protein kinase [Minicystis rosea]|nr:serine/threonine protein kinase [Minicystis rosea]